MVDQTESKHMSLKAQSWGSRGTDKTLAYENNKLIKKLTLDLMTSSNDYPTIEVLFEGKKKIYQVITPEKEEIMMKEILLQYDLQYSSTKQISPEEHEGMLFEDMVSHLVYRNYKHMERLPRMYVELITNYEKSCNECKKNLETKEHLTQKRLICPQHTKFTYEEFNVIFLAIKDFPIKGLIQYESNQENKNTEINPTRYQIKILQDQKYIFEIKRTIRLQGIAKFCDRIYSMYNNVLMDSKSSKKYTLNCIVFYNNKYLFAKSITYLIDFLNGKYKNKQTDSLGKIQTDLSEEYITLNNRSKQQKSYADQKKDPQQELDEKQEKQIDYWMTAIKFVREKIESNTINPILLYFFESDIILENICISYKDEVKQLEELNKISTKDIADLKNSNEQLEKLNKISTKEIEDLKTDIADLKAQIKLLADNQKKNETDINNQKKEETSKENEDNNADNQEDKETDRNNQKKEETNRRKKLRQ